MNRNTLKNYAPQARRDFITAVTDRAAYYGLTRDKIEPIAAQGDVVIIAGKPFPRHIAIKRKRLEERITRQGFEQTMEAMAYTWFNRFAAIRFMELHGYLDHGYRVLSHPDQEKTTPEIVEHAEHVDLPSLSKAEVIDLKLDGTREAELYRRLLIAQCNALHAAMPFLFERIDDETELLLPDNLLHSESLLRKLVNGIDEEDWQEVEIIGWLYQFYISEKKDQVIGKLVKSEDIPAATQLFTPNWIVKYLVQNSLGRQWMATYPNSPLKKQMEYYIEPAEQPSEVQAQLKVITPESLNPEELTLLDPACGSGHILVEAYELFKAIYQERGYRARDIPSLILQKNLFGLEIDDRAAQLAAFALMMKARADDRRIFASGVEPHVMAIQESKGLNAKEITGVLNAPLEYGEKQGQTGDIAHVDMALLIDLFEHGKTFGSLIRVPAKLTEKLPVIAERVQDMLTCGGMFGQGVARSFKPFVEQTRILSGNYDTVVTNPPYMGLSYFNPRLKSFLKKDYLNGRSDLYAAFILRNLIFCKANGWVAMITIPNWMTIVTFEALRDILINSTNIESLIDNGRGIWGADFGSCNFVLRNSSFQGYRACFKRLYSKQGVVSTNEEIQRQFLSQDIFVKSPSSFNVIPTKPLAYWISDTVISVFQHHPAIGDGAKKGLSTGDNDRFLRCWHEVDFGKTSMSGSYKWFPVTKGGPFRRWYGNYDYILNWHKDGDELRNFMNENGKARSVIRNRRFYFQSGITWNDITISSFSARWVPPGFIPMDAGPIIYTKDWKRYLCMLNSTVNWQFMSFLAPTCHFTVGTIASIPVIQSDVKNYKDIASDAIVIVKADWDAHETSWEFE